MSTGSNLAARWPSWKAALFRVVDLPITAALFALLVFVIDTATPIDSAVAVLYVVVIMAAVRFTARRGLLLVSGGCVVLTLLSYMVSHGLMEPGTAFLRCLVSLSAIGITTLMAMKNQSATAVLCEQAQLLNLTHDIIFVRDLQNVITYWNHGAEELYGWPRGEALGRKSHQLLQTEFPMPLATINETLLRSGRWEGELVHRRQDGRRIVVDSRWALQRDRRGAPSAILETNTDITERKQADAELRQSEARFRNIFQTTRIGIWEEDYAEVHRAMDRLKAAGVLDLRRHFFEHPEALRQIRSMVRVVDVNETAVRMVRAKGKEEVMQSLDRIFLPETDASFVALLDALHRGEPHLEAETVIQDVTGAPLSILMTVTFPPAGARSEHVLVCIVDITERKRAQEQLLEAQAALAHAARVATLGELTASIAHEVNQPLAAIVTSGEACLRWLDRPEPDLGEARSALERVIRDGRRASDVVGRIRALLKKADPQKLPLAVNDIVEEAVLLVQRELLNHQVVLRLELAPELPPVLGDRVQLQQVVINLLMNGAQAMANVQGRARNLTVTTAMAKGEGGEEEVVVCVQDAGDGIPPENLARLFSAFFTTRPSGMGMGLSICRSTVEAHGGRISAANRGDDGGAQLRFALPALVEHEA
jgi:PAS domain S-box-containing protein